MQHRFHAREMFGEKRAGKFHGEKLMLLVRRAPRRSAARLCDDKIRPCRRERHALLLALHETVAGEI